MLFAPGAPRPLRPDPSVDDEAYRRWLAWREHSRLSLGDEPAPGPEIDLLLVLDGSGGERFDATVRSLRAQTSSRWHLSLTVIGAPEAGIEDVLDRGLHELGPARSKMHVRPAATSREDALAAALEDSSSPACAFVHPGDVFAPDAVAQLSAALIDADVAYADEDAIGSDGLFRAPVLKPDWSPDLLLSWCYTGGPLAMRVAPLLAAGGIRAIAGGDWEHDLVLRVTERTRRVAHVAEVLCHRDTRATAVGASGGSGTRGAVPAARGDAAVVEALRRREERAEVEAGPLPATWHVRRRLVGRPSVSVIVPFRDSTRFLRSCTESLFATSSEVQLELLLVDNGSTEPETATLLERLARRPEVTVLRDDRPFNWAVLNNRAAAEARGEVLVFLNDDVEARTPEWLSLLVAHALRSDVGAAGGRLVYPDGTLQHAGIVVGMSAASGHVLTGLAGDEPGYLGMAVLTRDVSAVSGACMATAREVFERLEGFDERLWLDFNDIDYCLRARTRGLRTVYEPGAELVHHESPSRGTSASDETAAAFVERWRSLFETGDPFLNARLSRRDFSAALDEPEERNVRPGGGPHDPVLLDRSGPGNHSAAAGRRDRTAASSVSSAL